MALLTTVIGRGTTAAKPAAAAVPAGSLYYDTTLEKLQRSTGAAWEDCEPAAGSAHTIQDEGTPLTARANLNFVGAGVTATDDAGNNATVVTILSGGSGWVAAGETWTYASADAPTFTFTVTGDVSSKYSVGMRLKLTQATGGTKYFLVTKIAVAGDTTMTIYGGTDYTLNNEAVSSPYYSTSKAPQGFPLDPTKWTVKVSDTSLQTQAAPVTNTWYNLGTVAITIPLGVWVVVYQVDVQTNHTTGSACTNFTTLSTGNNTESDTEFTTHATASASTSIAMASTRTRIKVLTLASKTTYYLNAKTDNGGANFTMYERGDNSPTIIQAMSAYL